MTWLHMEFVLIFSPADGRELWQLCRTKCLLTLASLAETIKDPLRSFNAIAVLRNFDHPPFFQPMKLQL